eukprot:7023709-Pyramimonas_sp.AAC.1
MVYNDEVVPGNPLAVGNQRKNHVIYWGIKEYGWPTLASEYCWFTACVVRSSLVSTFPGNLSQLMRGVLKFFFGPPDAITDLRNGVAISSGNGVVKLLKGELGIAVMDERGFKFTFEQKGASGHLMCPLCQNC